MIPSLVGQPQPKMSGDVRISGQFGAPTTNSHQVGQPANSLSVGTRWDWNTAIRPGLSWAGWERRSWYHDIGTNMLPCCPWVYIRPRNHYISYLTTQGTLFPNHPKTVFFPQKSLLFLEFLEKIHIFATHPPCEFDRIYSHDAGPIVPYI